MSVCVTLLLNSPTKKTIVWFLNMSKFAGMPTLAGNVQPVLLKSHGSLAVPLFSSLFFSSWSPVQQVPAKFACNPGL